MINRIKSYFQGVISESKKMVATILFGAIDYGLSEGLKKILENITVGR
jgi:hypothetical protein